MILFNQDNLQIKYHTLDNLVFDINTNYKLEKILDDLREGKPISDIAGIQGYFISRDGKEYKENELNDSLIMKNYELYQERKENSYIPDYNVVHDTEYEGDVNTGDEFHAERFQVKPEGPFMINEQKTLNKAYQDYLFNVDTKAKVYPLSFENKELRKALINQVACTIGIMPTLLEMYPDKTTSELKKISTIAELSVDMNIALFYSDEYNEILPNKETVDILSKLSPIERQLLDCEMNASKVTDICVALKKKSPNTILTRDMVESFFYQHIDEYDFGSQLNDEITTTIKLNNDINVTTVTSATETAKGLFENASKYGKRSPGVLPEYVISQFNKNSRTNGNEIFNRFNLKSLQRIAKLKSEVLFALSDELNFNEIKQSHMEIIAALYPKELIPYLKNNKFIEYYNEHKNMSDNDLKQLLENYRQVYMYAMEIKKSIDSGLQHYASREDYDMTLVSFDKNKVPSLQIEELKEYKARQDCKGMEQAYHYKFKDNDLAIRGRDLVVEYQGYKMYMLQANDYRNFTIGYDTNCCQHYDGAGENCVYKLTSDPYAGAVVIEKNNRVLAQGFVWTDESKNTFVFDNVEFNNDRDVHIFEPLFSTWAAHMPYDNIQVGSGYNPGMATWGQPVSSRDLIKMPNTIDTRYIYSDYDSRARVIKRNGKVVLPTSACKVSKIDLIPSKLDIINNLGLSYLLSSGLSVSQAIDFGEKIENNTISDEEIKSVISSSKNHESLLEKLGELSEELQVWFYDNYPNELELIKNPCEGIAIKQVEKDPTLIKNIENPSEEMQVSVVRKSGLYFSLIHNPCELAAVEAVKQNGYAIMQMPQTLHTDAVIIEAMKTAPRVILSVSNPSNVALKEAITKEPQLVGLLEQKYMLPDTLKAYAINLDASVILNLKQVTPELVKAAVEKNGLLIRNFQRNFPEMKEFAIRQNPNAIGVINKPTVDDVKLALSIDRNCVSRIKDKELVEEVLNQIRNEGLSSDLSLDEIDDSELLERD